MSGYKTIDEMLNCGIYIDEFLDIIDTRNNHFLDFKPQFKQVIKHFGLEISPQQEVIGLIFVAYIVKKIFDLNQDNQGVIDLCKSTLIFDAYYASESFSPIESEFIHFCFTVDDNICIYGYKNKNFEKEIVQELIKKAKDWFMNNYEKIPHKELFIY